jgi:translation initiation factor IF-1
MDPRESGAHQVGKVISVLPQGLWLVRLPDGRQIRAGIPTAGRHAITRLIVGMDVKVKLAPRDDGRGWIIGLAE